MDPNRIRFRRYLECSACGKVEYCDASRAVERLQSIGQLRRTAELDDDLLDELFHRAAVAQMDCSACGEARLRSSREDPLEAQAWGDDRKCDGCGQSIPAERMEIFPDARRCARCQLAEDRGESQETPEYCPRCGNIMRLQRKSGTGIAGYTMACPSCRFGGRG